MIYLFAGDDAQKKILNYEKFIKSVPAGAEIFSINRNSFDPMQIESFYSGASLFSSLAVVVFQGILDYEEIRSFILEKLKQMEESENLFVFLEGKLNKALVDTFKKVRAEVNVFELPKEKKEVYDNFLIANAFGDGNKFHAWLYFRQAVDLGVSLEEVVGVLFWKMKDMILKKNFRNFSEKRLKYLAAHISYLLPEARKNGKDAEVVLEKFLLEAF